MYLIAVCRTAVSVTLGAARHPERKETAVWPTLSCPGGGLPALPGNPDPVPARLPALVALEEFRGRLHKCLTARADALFDLADAVLCSDHAVRSLVQLSLEPEFRRGHGALYDALAAGRVDDERLFCLLTEALPPLVDGDEARAWIADHDAIDHGMLGRALAGLAESQAAQVRDACARWSRVRVAVDATAYPRPDAWCSPGREHVHHGACHCRGSARPPRAGSTSSRPSPGTCAPPGQRSPACSGPPRRPGRHRRSRRSRPCCAACPPAGRCRCSSSTPATAPPP